MRLKDKRIFMIEDNLNNRAITQLLLEQQGAKTSFERWGKDTVAQVKKFMPVDLILLDLMFPNGVSGYDIFVELRHDKQLAHIPIVALSASDASVAIPKAQDLGFNGYLSKPIDFANFIGQIVKILDGERIWESSN